MTSSELSALTIQQIRQMHLSETGLPSDLLLRRMSSDPRSGVRSLARRLQRQRTQGQRRVARTEELLKLERRLWEEGFRTIAGVDEAGVGPLAGPVVAAAVILTPGTCIVGVDDSKRLRSREREELADAIRRKALTFELGMAGINEIEKLNIYGASLLAMRRALNGLGCAPDYALVDARTISGLTIPQQSIVRGDSQCFSIAAASILAKTSRDAMMRELDREFPEYGFARHKGYGTAVHQEALRLYGPCPAHRRSFLRVKELAGDFSSSFRKLEDSLRNVRSPKSLAGFSQEHRFDVARLDAAEKTKLQRLLRDKRKSFRQSEQLHFFAKHVE